MLLTSMVLSLLSLYMYYDVCMLPMLVCICVVVICLRCRVVVCCVVGIVVDVVDVGVAGEHNINASAVFIYDAVVDIYSMVGVCDTACNHVNAFGVGVVLNVIIIIISCIIVVDGVVACVVVGNCAAI